MSETRILSALLPEWAAAPQANVIADLTALPRFGLRGQGAADWLASQPIDLPPGPNLATIDAAGLLALRLGANDIAFSGLRGPAEIEANWRAAPGRNGVTGFRQDSWAHLAISGPQARELMMQLTEVDLRDQGLAAGAIAQTRMLHMDVVIVRSDFNSASTSAPAYELFFDIASRPFLLESLHHIAEGFRFLALKA